VSCHPDYLEVGVGLANHEAGLAWGLTASQVSAIGRARQAGPLFRIFPDIAQPRRPRPIGPRGRQPPQLWR